MMQRFDLHVDSFRCFLSVILRDLEALPRTCTLGLQLPACSTVHSTLYITTWLRHHVCRLMHAAVEGLQICICSLGAGPTLAATWPGSTTARWLWHGWRYHAMASVPCDFSLFKLHFCCRVLKAKKPALSIVG